MSATYEHAIVIRGLVSRRSGRTVSRPDHDGPNDEDALSWTVQVTRETAMLPHDELVATLVDEVIGLVAELRASNGGRAIDTEKGWYARAVASITAEVLYVIEKVHHTQLSVPTLPNTLSATGGTGGGGSH